MQTTQQRYISIATTLVMEGDSITTAMFKTASLSSKFNAEYQDFESYQAIKEELIRRQPQAKI